MRTWIHILRPPQQCNLQKGLSKFHSVSSKCSASVRLGIGASLGLGIGASLGLRIGASLGLVIGASVGLGIGALLGLGIGASLGLGIGTSLGLGISDRYPNLAPTSWPPQPQRCPKATA